MGVREEGKPEPCHREVLVLVITPELSLAAAHLAPEDGDLMPQVTFSYTGQLANAAGTPEETIELGDAATVRSALDMLATRYDAEWSELVFDGGGRIRSTLLVVLDGVQATGEKGSIVLDDTKSVMLMTPIAGG